MYSFVHRETTWHGPGMHDITALPVCVCVGVGCVSGRVISTESDHMGTFAISDFSGFLVMTQR